MDIMLQGPGISQHDISRGSPLPDETCAVVYFTALLEHMRRADVFFLLQERHRVLHPGGIIRLGVQDLERLY
jgi:predicted SAM-dependent methyltransferase